MPFTTSHPAIVLPLKKIYPKYVSLSGLMAGAMSPDLLYFLNLTTVHRSFSHSWGGLVYFCIPAGIIFTLLFHHWIKKPLLLNLPRPLDQIFSGLAYTKFGLRSLRSIMVLLISVTIGAMSHFFWDSFTHHNGVIAKALPFMTEKVTILGMKMYLTFIFQHISTLVGLLFIVYFFWRGNNLPEPIPDFISRNGKKRFWLIGGVVATIFATLVSLFFYKFLPHHPVSYEHIFGLSGWAGFTYYLIACSFLSPKCRQS